MFAANLLYAKSQIKKDREGSRKLTAPFSDLLPESLAPFWSWRFPRWWHTSCALSRVASSCGSIYLRDLLQGIFLELAPSVAQCFALSHNVHRLFYCFIFMFSKYYNYIITHQITNINTFSLDSLIEIQETLLNFKRTAARC